MDTFREIYERHQAAVYRLALFLTGDAAQADDLAAETFFRAWNSRHRILQPTVRAYLLTITRNLYRDQLRARRQFVQLDDQLVDRQPRADLRTEQASALVDTRERLRRVARGDRRALLMHALRQMSYADVAAALGISVAAVKTRIARARAALRASATPIDGERR